MVATNEQQDRTTASPRSDGGYAPGVGRDGGSVGGDAGARMLAVALHLVRARSGMVALLDDAAGLRLLASSGGVTLDLGPDASMARAARTEEDVRIVPDAAAGGDRASELSDALAAHGFRFVAIVPLRFADGSARGLVWLADPEPRALDEDDVRCLRDVAALLDAHPTRAGAPARAAPSENGDDRSVATGERRFRALADIAPAILWLSDADGRLSFLSRGWHEATGQSEAESSGDGWLQALHPDDRDEVRNRFL
ncbi:MAG: PAS domain S-box protein, partial [Trueperaceae bacterium]